MKDEQYLIKWITKKKVDKTKEHVNIKKRSIWTVLPSVKEIKYYLELGSYGNLVPGV